MSNQFKKKTIGGYFAIFMMYILPLIGIVLLFKKQYTIGGVLFFVSLGFMIFGGIYGVSKDKSLKLELEKEISKLLNSINDLSKSYIAKDYNSAIGISNETNKLYIIDNINYNIIDHFQSGGTTLDKNDYKYVLKEYDFRDILKSEIFEDGQSIISTSRTSQIGGALLGGFLAGGIGAIIGGLSASQTIENKVKKMDLNIIVNDTENPIYSVCFLDKVMHIGKYENDYKIANQEINKWHSLISVLIKKADDEDKEQEKIEERSFQREIHSSLFGNSVADELKKLNDLFKEGILSEDEYKEQKEKLLAKN